MLEIQRLVTYDINERLHGGFDFENEKMPWMRESDMRYTIQNWKKLDFMFSVPHWFVGIEPDYRLM